MIVRVIGDGQYEVDEGLMGRLNELDGQAMDALGRDDEETLDRMLEEMAALVREQGSRVPDETLTPSAAVIPPSDLTLEETRRLVSEQGFLPDPVTSG